MKVISIYKDNGYQNWQDKIKKIKKKRFRLILKLEGIVALVSLFVLLFGYDKEILFKEKIIEFLGGFIGLTVIVIIIVLIKNKVPKYIPLCNKCGKEIKDLESDCLVDIKYLGTIDKTVYEKMKLETKGKTIYPRGGYAMRNKTLERTSESYYQSDVLKPLVKKFYLYNFDYKCQNCQEPYISLEKELEKPLKIKDEN